MDDVVSALPDLTGYTLADLLDPDPELRAGLDVATGHVLARLDRDDESVQCCTVWARPDSNRQHGS